MRELYKKNKLMIMLSFLIFVVTSICFLLEIYGIKLMVSIVSREIGYSKDKIYLIAGIFIFSYLFHYIKLKILYNTYENNRKILSDRVFKFLFFNKSNKVVQGDSSTNETLLLFNNKIEIINQEYFEPLFQLFFSGVFLIGATVYLATISFKILIYSIIIYLAAFYLSRLLGNKTNIYQTRQLKSLSQLIFNSKEHMNNGLYFKLYKKDENSLNYLKGYTEDYVNNVFNKQFLLNTNSILNELLSNLRELIIIVVLFAVSLEIGLKNSEIFVVMYLSTMLAEPFRIINQIIHSIKSTEQVRSEFSDIFLRNISDTDEEYVKVENFRNLELVNVTYSVNDKNILSDVNIKFERGKKYLIIGSSGSGKTTLLNLITKYNGIRKGEVLFNNKQFEEIYLNNYYTLIDQNSDLFVDTVKNNITLYKDINLSKENSNILELLELDIDLDKIVDSDCSNLSGGEIQRIKLARALIHKKEILILDEAFSGVDPDRAHRLENFILEQDITLIAISHNLYKDLVPKYDEVIMIKDGRVEMVEYSVGLAIE